MKKILVLLAACVMALSVDAQIVSSTSKSIKRTVTATTEVDDFDNSVRFGIDLSVGGINYGDGYNRGAFGVGVRWVKPFNKYVAFDIASINWAASFSEPGPGDLNFLSAKTGVRGFSPKFANNMRAYMNLDLGYGGILVYDDYDEEMSYYSSFALEYGVGVYLTDKISVGYALNYETKFETTQHFFRVGFLF